MSLQQKVTKNASQFDGALLRLNLSYYELAKQHSFRSDTFNTSTLLRAIRRFLKALNFSLNVFGWLTILEVKNEELEQSFYLKRLHLS